MVDELHQQVYALQQENETGKVASSLMSKYMDAGVVAQNEEN